MKVEIKINTVPGHTPGSTVVVECDENGTPLSREWRRRLVDAKSDNCCEVVKKESKTSRSTKESKQPKETKKGN